MRIVHVIVGLNVGGAELMLKRLVLFNMTEGHCNQTVISLTDIGQAGVELVERGVSVIPLGMRSFLDIPRIIFRLMRIYRKIDPHIVQTWMYHSDLLGGIAARLAGVKNVLWGIRNTSIPQGKFSATNSVLLICALLSKWIPRKIICCAHSAKVSHIKKGYSARKMVVIPNGYDLSIFETGPNVRSDMRREFGFSQNDMVIGTVGRFDPLKGHENFIRAASLIASAFPQSKFLMIGRGVNPNNLALNNLILSLGMRLEQFRLVDQRNDVNNCFQAMDIFCLPSKSEGFPNVVCEAMATGLPTVVTDVGDAALIVDNFDLVVPAENPAKLANALRRLLLCNADELITEGNRGRDRIHRSFSISAVSDSFRSIYLSCPGVPVD